MKQNVRKVSLLTLVAVLVVAIIIGFASVLPKTPVIAQNAAVSTAQLIGEKTDNVTVTPAYAIGDYKGVLVKPASSSANWSANINSLFNGNTSITFGYVNNRSDSAAQGFSLYDANGNLICSMINFYANIWQGATRAYLFNNLTNVYTQPTATSFVEVTSLDQDPWHGVHVTPVVDQKLDMKASTERTIYGANHIVETLLSTVYFEYADNTLTVKINSLQFAEGDSKEAENLPKVLTVGVVENVDLSKGYYLKLHNQTERIGSETPFSVSHAVLLVGINGVDATASELTINDSVSNIQYDGENLVDEQNVISLSVGSYLGKFTYNESFVVADTSGNVLTLAPTAVNFNYDANKEFLSDELITVSYGTQSKQYYVDVTDGVAVSTSNFVKSVTNAKITNKKTVGSYTGVHIDKTNTNSFDRNVAINGVFNGNSSLTYLFAGSSDNESGHAFTIKDINGQEVLKFVNYYNNAWQGWGGNAYVYNSLNGKYTVASKTGVAEVDTLAKAKSSGLSVMPVGGVSNPKDVNFYGTHYTLKTALATVYFEYANGTITVKTTTPQKIARTDGTAVTDFDNNDEIVTVGVVQADLSQGYTIEFSNEATLIDTTMTNPSKPILLTAINGRSLGGDSVLTDSYSSTITCDNGEEVVENQNVITVVKGDKVAFSSATAYNFKSLTLNPIAGDKVDVQVATDTIGKFNQTVTVAGASKDYIINVISYAQSLKGVEMLNSAYIRFGSAEDGSDRGLRFAMSVSTELQSELEEKVVENYLTSYNYGMFIVPYDYIATYADFTLDAFFGSNATYTWLGKNGSGTVNVLNLTGNKDNLISNVLYAAIINLKVDTEKGINNVTRAFVGIGYIELKLADGTTEYKLVSSYETYAENGMDSTNNVRSAYFIAQSAYNDPSVSQDKKQAIYDAYLAPNGYGEN